MIRLPSPLPLLVLVCALAPGAAAKDYEEAGRVGEAEALLDALEAAADAKDRPRLEAALKQVPPLHNALKTKSVRTRLQKAVGRLLGDPDQAIVVRKAAAATLGGLYDERGVWSVLKPHLPAARDETIDQVGVAVLEALARVQADGAIGSLEKLARTAQDPNAARLAIAALGEYSYSKKRVAILEFLIAELTRLRPGNTKGARGRQDPERFVRVRDALVQALNRLTRRAEQGVEPWLALYKANKKAPEKLFRTER